MPFPWRSESQAWYNRTDGLLSLVLVGPACGYISPGIGRKEVSRWRSTTAIRVNPGRTRMNSA